MVEYNNLEIILYKNIQLKTYFFQLLKNSFLTLIFFVK